MPAASCDAASTTNDSAVTAVPITRGSFEPIFVEIRPPIGLKIAAPMVEGIRNSPACVTDEPNPYPVDVGAWTNCGIRTNALYIAEPQPQVGASLTARSSATSQPESRIAPSQWTFPGARTGDSGMNTSVATMDTSVTTPGIQNSQW